MSTIIVINEEKTYTMFYYLLYANRSKSLQKLNMIKPWLYSSDVESFKIYIPEDHEDCYAIALVTLDTPMTYDKIKDHFVEYIDDVPWCIFSGRPFKESRLVTDDRYEFGSIKSHFRDVQVWQLLCYDLDDEKIKSKTKSAAKTS